MSTNMGDAFRKAGFDVPNEPVRRGEMTTPRQQSRGQQGNRRQGDGSQNNRESHSNYQYRPQFPPKYFEPDNDGRDCLLPDFVSYKKVDELAQELHSKHMTTGQLRRFFNHCRDVERRLNIEGESWQYVESSVLMLSAHAHNAKAASKIPPLFQDFIDENVNKIKSADDPRSAFLRGFMPHFEALVGFGAAHMRDY